MQKLSRGIGLLTLFALGALLAITAELSYGGWIQLPLLALLWWQMSKHQDLHLKNQLLLGLAFGVGYFVIGLWWIYISLHDVGGMNMLLSAAAVLMLSSYMACFFSLATLSLKWFKTSKLIGLLLAASWVLLEFLRGIIFTGFPWMGFAETQVNGPFAPVAPILGGLACTFLVVWISWEIFRLKNTSVFSGICIVLAITLSQLASVFTFTHPTSNLPAGLLHSIQQFSTATSSTVLLGLIGEVAQTTGVQYSNRALGFSPDLPQYQYDKSHLVPFGEFVPPGFRWFVDAFHVPLSNFARGKLDQAPLSIARPQQEIVNAAITICYEDVFGGELAARLRNSTQPVNLLINMTNLAWFGKSQAPEQQLRLSQLRSLETGLPALRATNTGITAVLGSKGEILAQLPQFTQDTLSAKIQAYSGLTPYVIWGNMPILTLSGLLLIFGLLRQKRI
ncbi:MAG: apolipoprotein N-acyltransferase [Polynucleobacter sp. 17-46-58]|nr:MAG: apolipoprotein N-acyltransferase [Polynucleobacter sp. 17-46-58]